MERSLVLLKPDIVERNLIGEVLSIYEKNNLKIVDMNLCTATKEKAIEHYKEHIGRFYFDELIEYIQRSPIVAVVIEGDNAISKIREINGSVSNSKEGTIRAMYAVSKTENSVHASDSKESAEREIGIWF